MYYKKYSFNVYEFLEEEIHAFVAKLSNRCFCWFPFAMLEPISINLSKTFLRISRIRNIPLTWILARVFAYLPPFISQILDFTYWGVLLFILIYFEWRDTENQQYWLFHAISPIQNGEGRRLEHRERCSVINVGENLGTMKYSALGVEH